MTWKVSRRTRSSGTGRQRRAAAGLAAAQAAAAAKWRRCQWVRLRVRHAALPGADGWSGPRARALASSARQIPARGPTRSGDNWNVFRLGGAAHVLECSRLGGVGVNSPGPGE